MSAGVPKLRGARLQGLLLAQIHSAAQLLSAPRRPRDGAVHDARKQLQRSRATLRLMRTALGEAEYRADNIALRNAARPLTAVRDTKVLLDTLGDISAQAQAAASTAVMRGLQRQLGRERTRANAALSTSILVTTARRLQGTMRRLAQWPGGSNADKTIAIALRRSYRQGRRAMQVALKTRADDALHEWRKQVKYLRYQLEILRPLQPRILGRLMLASHKLADLLGRDHDLALLGDKIRRYGVSHRHAVAAQRLLQRLQRRRHQLQRKALKRGLQFYKRLPRSFVGHVLGRQ
jgi:CHAD domain-containing protein